MNPGITRGVPMGVLGYVLGAGIVVGERLLQGTEPAWDIGPVFVLGTFLSAGFFVWGMGAFDPRLSQHGEEHEAAAEDAPEEEESPLALLSTGVWQSTFWVIIMALIVGFFVFVTTDLARVTVDTAEGSVFEFAIITLNIFGEEIVLAQNALFVIFVVFMIFLLAATAAIFGLTFHMLARGLAETQGEASIEDRTPPAFVQVYVGGVARLIVKIIGWLPRLVQR